MGAVEHAVRLKVAGAAEADATHTRCPSTAAAATATTAAAASGGVAEGRDAGAVVGADAAEAGGQAHHSGCGGKVTVTGGALAYTPPICVNLLQKWQTSMCI